MKKANQLRVPAAWQALRPGEFMFSRKPYHELQQMAALLRKSGVKVKLLPTTGGYHVHCEARKNGLT